MLVKGLGGQAATHRWSSSGERTMEACRTLCAGKTGSDKDKHEPKTDAVFQISYFYVLPSAHSKQPQSVE